ncbi:Protein of unknown function [Pyronema omphalodes CBS 100304]|uniref:Uncharacterized protein n=1 Tax=Pyronema omphalodes (strain CBS 100304) TaxID=1076935 RepID=U4L6S8_PYROM|nr:Protein of unknown function [Pyronema omphalodes CBS 100304]
MTSDTIINTTVEDIATDTAGLSNPFSTDTIQNSTLTNTGGPEARTKELAPGVDAKPEDLNTRPESEQLNNNSGSNEDEAEHQDIVVDELQELKEVQELTEWLDTELGWDNNTGVYEGLPVDL